MSGSKGRCAGKMIDILHRPIENFLSSIHRYIFFTACVMENIDFSGNDISFPIPIESWGECGNEY